MLNEYIYILLTGQSPPIEQHFSLNQPLPFPAPKDVHIPDPNLAAAIRDQIGTPITTHTIADLTELEANKKQITDLTGIEHAQNLMKLSLYHNNISDVSPLSKLTKLLWLYIGHNNISDISPFSKLIHLRLLDVGSNDISEIPPLNDLIHLDFFQLGNNSISDLSPLTALKKTGKLYLFSNTIPDVSPLSKLTQLEFLDLSYNKIEDVNSLTELVNLKKLYLVGNPIENTDPLKELIRMSPSVEIYVKDNREPALPVTLSVFRADHTNAGVLLKWTTEAEIDNAGFYIYRSQTRDGEFKIINQNIIQGAGTTGERNEYTWTDTTAKSNTVYYYRIEDVSHAGERESLATVRLRGLISAAGKRTTRWSNLKMSD